LLFEVPEKFGKICAPSWNAPPMEIDSPWPCLLLNEITAAMAEAWLAACDRRAIGAASAGCVVLDLQQKVSLFGPASADECRVFIHRSAALDVLRMLGTERVAGAAIVAGGNLPVTLNG
jgi:hypothetical protein